MVENGNGYFKQKLKPGESGIVQEGTVVGGFKEGDWSGAGAPGDFSFKEKYLKGKLISGESLQNGKSYTYTFVEEVPTFEGGMGGFYTYVQKSIRYPEDAFKQQITGSVSVSFVVEADGSLSGFKVIKSVSQSLDKEALRIMKGSPKWIPGKQNGIPVRTMLNMPFTFAR
ncbi:energy transducer TonB [Pedobacter frigoris]|uniref:Energy transducer TonB n=2 Tax=Pedobacter frigoris TaxID=2571272 RepID=A0A4U1CG17_9SPHI|nr:energy transducer TonB [Pedobacter frigoris]